MHGRSFAALAACLTLWAGAAAAQDGQLGTETAPAFVVVDGLAPSDLLNVRATASPTGLLLNRVQNGTMLKSYGCTPVNGYDWCRIEGVNDPVIKGWTPSRYLVASGAAPREPAAAAPVASTGEIVPDMPAALAEDTAEARPSGPTNMDAALAEAVQSFGREAAATAASRPPAAAPSAPKPVTVAAAAPTTDEPATTPVASPVASEPSALASAAPETPSVQTAATVPAPATPAAASTVAAQAPAAIPAPTPVQAVAIPSADASPASTQTAAGTVPPEESAPLQAEASRQADLPAASEPPAAAPVTLTVLSPAVIVICGFPLVFMLAMASIASFGSFTFTTPFEGADAMA